MRKHAFDSWCVGLHFLREYGHGSVTLNYNLLCCEFQTMFESESNQKHQNEKETKYISKTITNTLV